MLGCGEEGSGSSDSANERFRRGDLNSIIVMQGNAWYFKTTSRQFTLDRSQGSCGVDG